MAKKMFWQTGSWTSPTSGCHEAVWLVKKASSSCSSVIHIIGYTKNPIPTTQNPIPHIQSHSIYSSVSHDLMESMNDAQNKAHSLQKRTRKSPTLFDICLLVVKVMLLMFHWCCYRRSGLIIMGRKKRLRESHDSIISTYIESYRCRHGGWSFSIDVIMHVINFRKIPSLKPLLP